MDERLLKLTERLHRAQGAWTIEADEATVEVNPRTFEERQRRCTLRLYINEQGKLGAFFYKRSLLPYSRNRYSYGHLVVSDVADDAQLQSWLDFVASGFHPDRRPPRLRRAAPDTMA